MFAILVVIAVLYPVANVISALVKEKELRIKEGLKMMGLTGAAHTASWVFHFACLFFFTSLLMVLCSGNIFKFRCCVSLVRVCCSRAPEQFHQHALSEAVLSQDSSGESSVF